MTTHKVYVDTENLSREQLEQLLIDKEQENKTLKDNVEFLHSCLDDRDNSIELMKEEIKKLKSDLSLVIKERDDNIKQNKKLENKILKLWTRIYQNIDWKKREEYQEYCKRNKL